MTEPLYRPLRVFGDDGVKYTVGDPRVAALLGAGGPGGGGPTDAEVAARIAGATRTDPPVRFDDYRGVADGGALLDRNAGRTPSGHPYVFQGVATAGSGVPAPTAANTVVRLRADGTPELRLTTSGADYLHTVDPAGEIDEAGMGFAFKPGGSTRNGAVCLAVSNRTGQAVTPGQSTGVFSNCVHGSYSPDYINTSLTDGPAGLLRPFESGAAIVNQAGLLPTDDTPLYVLIKRTAWDRLRILIVSALAVHYDSDNAAHPPIRDSRIPSWWGSTIGVEHLRPFGTLATDAEPVILPWRTGPLLRRERSNAPAAGMAGIPGGAGAGATAAIGFFTGTTYYVPMEAVNPLTIASLVSEVVAASGTAGAVMALAVHSANHAWQPREVLHDLGTIPIDSTGVKTLSALARAVAGPRRALLGFKVSANGATFRAMPYSLPSCPNMRAAVMGASPFAAYFTATEAFSAAWPAAPTQWTNHAPPVAGASFYTPAVLTWSEN